VFIRINPNKGAGEHYKMVTGGPESKFGISEDDLEEARMTAERYGIKIIGLHQHIGSNFKLKDKKVFM
jgi:diaminopimelate decarboxylase